MIKLKLVNNKRRGKQMGNYNKSTQHHENYKMLNIKHVIMNNRPKTFMAL